MVVLTLAVIAGAGALVLHRAAPGGQDQAAVEKAFRKLADRDPDVGHEAEVAVRALGPKAIEPLAAAAKSPNRILAERAQRLLTELAPVPPAPPSVDVSVPEKLEIAEFVLEARGGRVRAADVGSLWVQFRNNGTAPVLVAHGFALDHPGLAVFEVEDEKGVRRASPAQIGHLEPADLASVIAIPPHDSVQLFVGGMTLAEAVARPGTYRIRFLYDAREGSDYRKLVTPSAEGTLLPPARLASNPVTVTVTE
jgi:hypothetical protein